MTALTPTDYRKPVSTVRDVRRLTIKPSRGFSLDEKGREEIADLTKRRLVELERLAARAVSVRTKVLVSHGADRYLFVYVSIETSSDDAILLGVTFERTGNDLVVSGDASLEASGRVLLEGGEYAFGAHPTRIELERAVDEIVATLARGVPGLLAAGVDRG